MITLGDLTADSTVLKIRSIHANWAVMYAGNVSPVKPILQRIRSGIPDSKRPVSLEEVQTMVEKSFREELYYEQDRSFLAHHRMDVQKFQVEGRRIFGGALFAHYCERLEQISLGCELLVAGFDEHLGGHIFSVTNPGKAAIHDDMGYWAIGSGNYRALSTLFFHSFNTRKSLEEGIYHVCEAKFMSEERELGIGDETSLLVCRRNDDDDRNRIVIREIQQKAISEIRKIWNDEGKPRLPNATTSVVRSGINEAKKMIFG